MTQIDLEYARELDRRDDLAHFRNEFVINDPDLIYLDGNSLGRLPKRTAARMREVIEQEWGERLIRGWSEGWFTAPQLIGAQADEVIVADSTSVNLFKLYIAALQARPERHKVVTDDLNFPSDVYVLQGAVKLAGPVYGLEMVRSADGLTVSNDALQATFDKDTALVTLTHTAFKSGYVYDMGAVTEMAHRAGALVLWNLCHSVGAMPIALNDCGVDLAVGCTYKYLNGGPGSPAFLYVRRFLAGTLPILLLAAVEPGVDLIFEAGPERLREKSVKQTEYLIALWEVLLKPLGVTLNSPRDSRIRGSHVSLGHPEGLRIDLALIHDMRVIPDFRYPDNIRLGIVPLYTTFAEIHEAIMRLRHVIVERLYEKYPTERPEVT